MNFVTPTMNKLLVTLFIGVLALFAGADAFAQATSAARRVTRSSTAAPSTWSIFFRR